MQGSNPLRSLPAVALLAATLTCGTATASAATGGTTAPSHGSAATQSSAGGTKVSTGATSPIVRTGGVSPSSVRPPSAPVKRRKTRRRRPRRRHHTHTPTPAPATLPAAGPVADIPSHYLALYRAAAARNGVDWRILAAIGKNESDHGRSTAPGVSSGLNLADCCSGPMQLCTVKSCGRVWQFYAADAGGDGVASVYDPDDAIYAAAALLRDLEVLVGDDPDVLLAAYNAGPGNVKRYRGIPPFRETQAYVRAGLAYIASLR